MTIAISLTELKLHIAEALSECGIGVDAFEVLTDCEGGWRIQLHGGESAVGSKAWTQAASRVEKDLGRRYKVHRLSLGGAYGG
jgi:hypothetical protein